MAKKVQLKDSNGNKAYPVTSSACVGMSDGSGSLDKKIAGINSKSSYVTCTTGAGTAAKTVPLSDFALSTGIRLVVKMSYANTAASATLNVNNTGAKPLFYNGALASADNSWDINEIIDVFYDGMNYQAFNIKGGGSSNIAVKLDWKTNVGQTRSQIPIRDRNNGLILMYKPDNGNWIIEQYLGSDKSKDSAFNSWYNWKNLLVEDLLVQDAYKDCNLSFWGADINSDGSIKFYPGAESNNRIAMGIDITNAEMIVFTSISSSASQVYIAAFYDEEMSPLGTIYVAELDRLTISSDTVSARMAIINKNEIPEGAKYLACKVNKRNDNHIYVYRQRISNDFLKDKIENTEVNATKFIFENKANGCLQSNLKNGTIALPEGQTNFRMTQYYINVRNYNKVIFNSFKMSNVSINGANFLKIASAAFFDADLNPIIGIPVDMEINQDTPNNSAIAKLNEVELDIPKNAIYLIFSFLNDNPKKLLLYKGEKTYDPYNDKKCHTRIDVTSTNLSPSNYESIQGLDISKNEVDCSIRVTSDDSNQIYEQDCKIAYQGATSINMPKKGYTLIFQKKHRFKNWLNMDEFHCKGYYSDWMHLRDLTANKILEQVYMTRPINQRRPYMLNNDFESGDIRLLADSGAFCHIDGFPCELYINGFYRGIYSINIKKDRDNYMLEKNNLNHIQIEAALDTKYNVPFDWKQVEIRNPKSDSGNEEFIDRVEPNPGEVKTAFETFLTNLNAITERSNKEDLEKFINVPDFIDSLLVCIFLNHTDNWSKNTLYTSWDGGKHFSPLLYDMDNTFGIVDITGVSTKNSDYDTLAHKAYSNCPWLRNIETILDKDIQARYKELRDKKVFSSENINKLIDDFIKEVGYEAYDDDTKRWFYPGLGNNTSSFVDSQARMEKWIADRIVFLDGKYKYVIS